MKKNFLGCAYALVEIILFCVKRVQFGVHLKYFGRNQNGALSKESIIRYFPGAEAQG